MANEELPEGITYNNLGRDDWWDEPDSTCDYQDLWSCNSCELSLEALLLVPYGRHEGVIRNVKNQSQIWNNKLPKSRDKALKILKETFYQKVENHRKAH